MNWGKILVLYKHNQDTLPAQYWNVFINCQPYQTVNWIKNHFNSFAYFVSYINNIYVITTTFGSTMLVFAKWMYTLKTWTINIWKSISPRFSQNYDIIFTY